MCRFCHIISKNYSIEVFKRILLYILIIFLFREILTTLANHHAPFFFLSQYLLKNLADSRPRLRSRLLPSISRLDPAFAFIVAFGLAFAFAFVFIIAFIFAFALTFAFAFALALALVDLRERAMAALARRRLLRHQQQLVGSALHVAGKRQVWRATRAAPLARGATEVLVEGRAGAQHPVAVELRGWV